MENLNLAHICPTTRVLGPGNRFALWVQGCPFNCKGCLAPDWIPFKKANVVSVASVAAFILKQEEVNGITISGGEPMMQAAQLGQLLEIIRKERPEWTVLVFTGFTLEQLVWDEAVRFLTYIDVLIDGQYVAHKNDGAGLRGSSNQRFHFLSNRLLPFQEEIMHQRPGLEFHILDDGVLMTGIPPADFQW